MSATHLVPGAKAERARAMVQRARDMIASACFELGPIVGAERMVKEFSRVEGGLSWVVRTLEKFVPKALNHPVVKGCPCACGQLAELLEEHGPKCPAFGRAAHLDYDPEMCDPELCEPERHRIERRSAAAGRAS